jgi:hypothetical protein
MVVQLCKSVRIKGRPRVGFVWAFMVTLWGYKISTALSSFTVPPFTIYFL